MKVLAWRGDRELTKVVGVYYQIGENCEKIRKLLAANWTFSGTTEPDPESNKDADITLIHSTGILVPETDNAADSEAVAVYLKFVSKDPNQKPTTECMIKIGYLPKDSDLKKRIKQPIQVSLRCRTISTYRYYFQTEVVGVPFFDDYAGFIEKDPTFEIDDIDID
ncbi:MAG: hypothetical protein H9W80_10605 [Enterococcus sp.]|nr:hypothetical protein [Enterococcus sp.]